MINNIKKVFFSYTIMLTCLLLGQHALVYSASEEADGLQQLTVADGGDQFLQLLLSQHNWSQDEIQEAFCTAIELGYFRAVKELIEHKNAQVNGASRNGRTPIYIAARHGQLEIVQYLVAQGASIHTVDDKGTTLLHVASFCGKLDIVKYLISLGCDKDCINKSGITPLDAAIARASCSNKNYLFDPATQRGCTNAALYLIKAGAKLGLYSDKQSTPVLVDAIHSGQLELIKALIFSGQRPDIVTLNGDSLLHIAAIKGHLDITEFLVHKIGASIDSKDNDGLTPLGLAALSGQLDIVKFLIASGARQDVTSKKGNSLLHHAVQEGHPHIVKFLIDTGLRIDLQNSLNVTPLHLAIQKGHADIAQFLITSGARINFNTQLGAVVLFNAKTNGKIDIVKLCMRLGANSNLTYQGKTLLHAAAQNSDCAIIEYLVANGANINAQTPNSELPLDLALKQETLEAASLLLILGAHYTKAHLCQMIKHKDFGNALWGLLHTIHAQREKIWAAWQEILQLKTQQHEADFSQWRQTSEGQACDVLCRILSPYINHEPIPYLRKMQTVLSQHVPQDLVKELFEFTGLPWRKVDEQPIRVPMDERMITRNKQKQSSVKSKD